MKKLLLLLLIFLLSGCSKVDLGATSDISATALASKYNLATEIKAKYAINGVALKATPKADPKDTIRVTIGDDSNLLGADKEFIPSVKISRWDEVSMKLTPKGLDKIASRDKKLSFEGNKIKFETPKQNFELYDLPANKDLPEGGYEFEWILKEKPATNIVEFDIETEGLEFYYQPIYTEEEINQLAEQNNFINKEAMGSYAVYTSDNKINYAGGKEYKIGKVGQIHRPKIIDNSGKEVFGDIKIDGNILSVTIPQDFIDNAVYPIRHAAGLTFGYETAGTAGSGGWNQLVVATAGMVDQYTASTGDTITGFSIYGYATNSSGPWNLAIAAYTVSGGNPTTRLSAKVDISVNTSANWYSVSSLSQSMSNGVTYCSAWSGEDYGGLYTIAIYYDNGSAPGRFNSTNTTLESTFGVTGTDSGRHYSVYATYTAGGAAPTYCGHTGGDWYVNSECWISTSTTTPGNVYIGTGGSLNCNNGAIISARSRSVGNGGSYSIGNSGGNCGWSLWTPQ